MRAVERVAAVTVTPQAQSLVDQLIQALGLQACRVQSLEIHLDRERLVQTVNPTLRIERVKSLDKAEK